MNKILINFCKYRISHLEDQRMKNAWLEYAEKKDESKQTKWDKLLREYIEWLEKQSNCYN